MKNSKFVKISLLVLSLVLCFGAMFAMNTGAEEPATKKPEIVSQNVEYTDRFSLIYAVDASTATGPVELYLYEKMPGEEAPYYKKYTANVITNAKDSGCDVDAYIFITHGVGATAMTKEFYVQAVDAKGNKSEIKKYSVAEYLYERLSTTGDKAPSEDQAEFYHNTIAFGANAQKVLAKEGENPQLISDYSYVILNDGTVGGVTKGIFPVGTKLYPYVNAVTANWNVTATAADGTETSGVQNNGFVVPDAIKTVATVESKIDYRTGIETFAESELSDFKTISSKQNSADGKYYSFNGNPKYAYVTDPDRGTVAKLDISARGDQLNLKVNNTTVAKENATAFECSFDIKMEMPAIGDNNKTGSEYKEGEIYRYMRWRISDTDTSSVSELNIYGNTKPSSATEWTTTGLYTNSAGAADHQLSADVDTEEWFHVRMVVHAADPYVAHFYINGVEATRTASLSTSTYNGDISTLAGMTFLQYNVPKTYIYIDNLYCGLIAK